jgi:DNA-directed RNA polymerase specialized sigma24 family protein
MTTTTLTFDTFGRVLHSPGRRLAWLHEHHGPNITRVIKRVTCGLLPPEDLQDVYQDTLRHFCAFLRDKPLPAERYFPVLRAIARHKGIDALRRRGRRPNTNRGAVLSRAEDRSPDSLSGGPVWERMGLAERREFQQVLMRLVEGLPERQRLVARVYLDHFEDFGKRDTYARLAELVSAISGRSESAKAVKSLWHAGWGALAAGLQRSGFSLEGASKP